MPVPAGMSLPMMTFSFRPSRESLRAWIAASVRTRVVSWNDAADSHDSVAREAFVMPMSTGRPGGRGAPPGTPRPAGRGLAALGHDPTVLLLEARTLGQFTRQQLGVTGLEDVHPLEHLANDDLDVLVVNRHTLRAVDLLDLLNQVQLHGA